MNGKKWATIVVATITAVVVGLVALVSIVDPYFHYHAPIKGLSYTFSSSERYLNNGIVKNFDYDAIITGTSMTENFKTSELDSLLGVNSIKVAFAGSTYKEINDNLKVALEHNDDIKVIVRGLDEGGLVADKNLMGYSDYPTFLYDNNIFNDTQYWFNKVAIKNSLLFIKNTLQNKESETFDQYANWTLKYPGGKETTLGKYVRPTKFSGFTKLTDEEKVILRDNMKANVTDLAEQYPDTEFIYFLSPYSVCYWDSYKRIGQIDRQIEIEKIAIEMMLEHSNISVYYFNNNFDLVCDLNNYRDTGHYVESVNSKLLQYIANNEYQVTKDNYLQVLEETRTYYDEFDYDSIFGNN